MSLAKFILQRAAERDGHLKSRELAGKTKGKISQASIDSHKEHHPKVKAVRMGENGKPFFITEEEELKIIALVNEGKVATEIAEVIGRTADSIRGYCRRNGLPLAMARSGYKSWEGREHLFDEAAEIYYAKGRPTRLAVARIMAERHGTEFTENDVYYMLRRSSIRGVRESAEFSAVEDWMIARFWQTEYRLAMLKVIGMQWDKAHNRFVSLKSKKKISGIISAGKPEECWEMAKEVKNIYRADKRLQRVKRVESGVKF